MIYRKHKKLFELEWHFCTDCPRWPASDFIEVDLVTPVESERLCKECVALASKMIDQRQS